MKIKQATNRAIEALAAIAERATLPDELLPTIALQNYRQALSTGLEAGTFVLTDYDVADHGLESSQYFQGCGTAFTSFDHVDTGCGDNPHEAIDDALESIAQRGIKIPDRLDVVASNYPIEPSASDEAEQFAIDEGYSQGEMQEHLENSEIHYYISIRYNVQFSHTETATEYVQSIRNGNCKFIVEALQEMPIERALAVTAYILEYLPDEDCSYRNRFLSTLGVNAD